MRLIRPFDTHDPFALFQRVFGDVDRAFGGGRPAARAATARWRVPLTVHETDDAYTVRLPLPGIDPEALDVTVDGPQLRISGSRPEHEGEGTRRLTAERWSGSFAREIELPQAVDPAAVSATYDDGVLTVTLGKSAAATPKTIPVTWNRS